MPGLYITVGLYSGSGVVVKRDSTVQCGSKITTRITSHNNRCISAHTHPTEIPVFPTVTAIVTMEEYKTCDTQDSKFLIPRDYTKVRLPPRNNSKQEVIQEAIFNKM